MSSAPTRGAVDQIHSGWVGKPAVARSIRILLFFAPMFIGWLAVRLTKHSYSQPSGTVGVAIWVVQAFVVAGLSSYLAVRIARRMTPLTTMLQLTLIFPDQAPSRLGIALRGGTIKKLEATTDLSGKSDQAAAEQAIALITQLGKHERLTRGHTERVRARAELIGAEMGLDDDELQKLRWGVLLHDVGKLEVPAHILNKESKLTGEEWALMRAHPANGARIVEPLRPWLGDWVDASGEHHERWDGEGYPHGLSGTEISLAGRITAVADAYDVITSKRSYKDAMTAEAARQELVRCSGNQFDPAVVRAALQVGLREPKRIGLLGWLFELPVVARFAMAIPSTVAAAAAATVVVAGSIGGGVVETTDVPVAIALAQPDSAARQDLPELTPVGGRAVSPPSASAIEATEGIDGDAGQDPEVPGSGSVATEDSADPVTSPNPTTTPGTQTGTTPDQPETVPGQGGTVPVAPGSPTTAPAPPVAATSKTTPLIAPTTTTATTVAPTTTTATTVAPTTTTASTTTTTVATAAIPTGIGIVVLAGVDVPDDLSNNALESNTLTFVIQEKQAVTLDTGLPVVTFTQDQETVIRRNPMTTLPVDSVVCSWLVRLEPQEGVVGEFTVSPVIDFGSTILGLAPEESHLADTNVLALDGVNYVSGSAGASDSFTVSGSVLSLSMRTGLNGLDQIRVITAC